MDVLKGKLWVLARPGNCSIGKIELITNPNKCRSLLHSDVSTDQDEKVGLGVECVPNRHVSALASHASYSYTKGPTFLNRKSTEHPETPSNGA